MMRRIFIHTRLGSDRVPRSADYQNHTSENPHYRRLTIVTVWLGNLEEHPWEVSVSTSQGQNAYPSTRPGRCNAAWSCVWEAPPCHVELSRKESYPADV